MISHIPLDSFADRPLPTGRVLRGLLVTLIGVAAASAQTNPPNRSDAAQQSDETKPNADAVILSPFQVNADQDVGYLAGNSVSGSRFNTRLKDISAQVAVFTPEFIMDLGANNLEEVMRYSASYQTDYDDTATAMSGAPFGGVSEGPSDTRFRIRNIAASRAIDFFESHIVNDNYNVGRFEAVSGPNAILFGFGSAGGVVNTTSKRALTSRNLFTYRLQVGSWEKLRNEVDLNYALVRDKLGVRLMGVQDSANSWRKWDYNEQERGTIAVTYQPFQKTAVRALYEKGHMQKNQSNPTYSLFDGVALWLERGRVVKDGFNAATDRLNGLTQLTGVRHVFVENTGVYFNGQNQTVSTFENLALPVAQRAGLTLLPENQFPYNVSNNGPGARTTQDLYQGRVFIEQRLTDKLSVELTYNKMWNLDQSINTSGTDTALNGDSSLTNPAVGGGRVPNPNAGKLYLESSWLNDTILYDIEHVRATVASEFDLGKWFGRHKPAALFQVDRTLVRRRIGLEMLIDQNGVPISDPFPENTANLLIRRQYVTDGAFDTYYRGNINVPIRETINGRTYTSRWITRNENGQVKTKTATDTMMLATQSHFWRDRLTVLFGYRVDNLETTRFFAQRVPAGDPRIASGERLLNEWDFGSVGQKIQDFKPTTRSVGGVLHATKHISFSYNESSNVGQPIITNASIIPDASSPPTTSGKGSDWGMMFDLFDGRLFMRVNRYETSSYNTLDAASGVITAPAGRIMDTLRAQNIITQADYDRHLIAGTNGLSDAFAKGVEVTVTANPMRNWALQINYSYNNQSKTGLFREAEAAVRSEEKFWRERIQAAGLVTANVSTGGLAGSVGSVEDEIAQIYRGISDRRLAAELGFGRRPHKANIFTRYTFGEGRLLKGFLVGGGMRYQSKSFNQRDVTTGRDFWGEPILQFDLLVGYRKRLAKFYANKPLDLSIQLNITNLLDDSDALIGRLNNFYNAPRRIYLQEPRNFRLTTTVSF
ncbi:MAG: hypothetical protein Q7S40_28495 [Opitutaceae bacterium]|nr:hypothetical protein [Opitutaceae bacterium]